MIGIYPKALFNSINSMREGMLMYNFLTESVSVNECARPGTKYLVNVFIIDK